MRECAGLDKGEKGIYPKREARYSQLVLAKAGRGCLGVDFESV